MKLVKPERTKPSKKIKLQIYVTEKQLVDLQSDCEELDINTSELLRRIISTYYNK